jgi:hypothetical protein
MSLDFSFLINYIQKELSSNRIQKYLTNKLLHAAIFENPYDSHIIRLLLSRSKTYTRTENDRDRKDEVDFDMIFVEKPKYIYRMPAMTGVQNAAR